MEHQIDSKLVCPVGSWPHRASYTRCKQACTFSHTHTHTLGLSHRRTHFVNVLGNTPAAARWGAAYTVRESPRRTIYLSKDGAVQVPSRLPRGMQSLTFPPQLYPLYPQTKVTRVVLFDHSHRHEQRRRVRPVNQVLVWQAPCLCQMTHALETQNAKRAVTSPLPVPHITAMFITQLIHKMTECCSLSKHTLGEGKKGFTIVIKNDYTDDQSTFLYILFRLIRGWAKCQIQQRSDSALFGWSATEWPAQVNSSLFPPGQPHWVKVWLSTTVSVVYVRVRVSVSQHRKQTKWDNIWCFCLL